MGTDSTDTDLSSVLGNGLDKYGLEFSPWERRARPDSIDTDLSSVLENRANEKQAVSDGRGFPKAIAKNREKDTFQPQRAVTDS